MISEALALLLVTTTAAAENGSDLVRPSTAPEPWVFTLDSVAIDLRIEPGKAPPVLARWDSKLSIVATLPMDSAVLRVTDLEVGPLTTDAGVRVGLLWAPPPQNQPTAADVPFNRERAVRLVFDLTPPARPCHRLRGLSGQVTVAIATGAVREAALAPTVDASFAAADLGEARVVEVTEKNATIVVARALADRLARIAVHDADGQEVPTRTHELSRDEEQVQLAVDVPRERRAKLVIGWYPDLQVRRLDIAIPEIDVPGGIPGVAALAEPPPPKPPAAPAKPPALKKPLHQAIQAGDTAEAIRLIGGGADPEAADVDTRRPLHRAVTLRQAEVVAALVARHVDLEARGRDGLSPLQLAAGADAITAALLAAGADARAAAPANGWTALHSAVAAGDEASVRALIVAGAEPMARAKDGKTAIDLAREQGRWRLVRMLVGGEP